MNKEQRKRLGQLAKIVAVALLFGIAYFIFIKLTGWALPCPIRLVTGKYCPGCGSSRMMLALLRFDFEEAFRANRLLFFLLPLVLVYGLVKGIRYIKMGQEKQTLPEQIAVFLVCVATVVFWVMRNMEQFAFLAPMGR